MFYNNLKILFNNKQIFKLYLIFFAGIFSTFFEVVGIGSIPIFIMLITDIDFLISKMPNFISIDLIYQIGQNKLIIIAAIVLGLIFIFKNLYLFLLLFFQNKFMMQLRQSTTNKIFKYYINSPYLNHYKINPATYVRTIEADVAATFVTIECYLALFREILILISVFLLLVFTDIFISFFSLILLVLPVLIYYFYYRKTLKEKGQILVKKTGERIKITNQSLGGIKETKILSKENFFLDKFFKTNQIIEKIGFFSSIISVTPRLFLEVSALLAITSISAILIMIGRPVDAILPMISLLAISAVRFIPALNIITSSLTTIRIRKYSIDLIVDLIKKANLLSEKKKSEGVYKKNFSKNEIFSNNIKLKNISFNYGTDEKIAVNNINIDIAKGKSVGLIGKSGSGKSTLVDIIIGLLEPSTGEILIDDSNIGTKKISWQKQLGYVPQEVYLLDDTIRNNITFGIEKEEIDEKLLSDVIEKSQLKNLINSLPKKLDTLIGDRGARLSGGEKQRVGIARALYNKPKVIVFDEATSSLDIYNENKILKEIYENKKDKTLIIISHRNNTVKYCDLIYVMEDGKIIDNGTFEQIMKKHSYLKENVVT
jgi:ATP-binding cassette subfamily C protein